MRSLMKFITFLLFIALIAVAFLSYFRLDDHEIGLILEKESGQCVGIFHDPHSFIWQGADLYRYHVTKTPREIHDHFGVQVAPVGAQTMEQDEYFPSFDLAVSYTVDPKKFTAYDFLAQNREPLKRHVSKTIDTIMVSRLHDQINAAYTAEVFYEALTAMVELIDNKGIEELNRLGIDITSLKLAGSPQIPDEKTIKEGLIHRELIAREALKSGYQDIQRAALRKDEEQRHARYMEHLKEMAQLLQQYPDLIKYIYIDKLTSDTKSNARLGVEGFPPFLERKSPAETQEKTVAVPGGNIDNFKYE